MAIMTIGFKFTFNNHHLHGTYPNFVGREIVKITSIHIQNFRKLLQCRIDFSKETTLFVGANNSGKTSAMDALGKFLAGRGFVFNDITISNRPAVNVIGAEWAKPECEMPEDLLKWEPILPQMDIWIEVSNSEIHYSIEPYLSLQRR